MLAKLGARLDQIDSTATSHISQLCAVVVTAAVLPTAVVTGDKFAGMPELE